MPADRVGIEFEAHVQSPGSKLAIPRTACDQLGVRAGDLVQITIRTAEDGVVHYTGEQGLLPGLEISFPDLETGVQSGDPIRVGVATKPA